MGSIGDCFDNSVAESFFGTLQLELLDQQAWTDRQQLALAVFDRGSSLVQPAPPALLLPHAQPHRLRDRPRGMIPTTHPSARTGEAQGS
jgi:putative transposase